MRVTIVAMETQDKNAFHLYGWGTYVAAKNGINTESVAMETERCVLFIVAVLRTSLPTVRKAPWFSCRMPDTLPDIN
jgi:hypothetical protein